MLPTIMDAISLVSVTSDCIKAWRKKQIEERQWIILAEIRDGVFDNIEEDDQIAIAHRLWRAISEGAAKNNFRLMCRLVQGLGENKQLTAPNFLQFASILDSLSEDEIATLAHIIKNYDPEKDKDYKSTFYNEKKGYLNIDNDTGQALLRTGLLRMEIATNIGIEEEHDWKVIAEGGNKYKQSYSESETLFYFTGLMHDLMKYVDFFIDHEIR